VVVQSIKVVKYSWPILKVDVVCGPGVYIRSLARDIGEKLSTGAYMTELERIRVGEFTKEEALQLENVLPGQFGEKSGNQRVDKAEKECPPE
jgi:tRNA pseudouridine55 synthase